MEDIASFGELHLVDDVSAADWIVAGVRNFQYDVGSLLPVTYEAYARVLHPALRDCAAGDGTEVTWAEVAAANGRVAHAAMEWVAITGGWSFVDGSNQPGIWDARPSTGSLPQRQGEALAHVLEGFTSKPSACWFAVWDGYGNAPYRRGSVAFVKMPQRPMALLRGPLSLVGSAFSGPGWPESASLWWPGDRAWCVATDIDLMSTYVAGTTRCIEAVLASKSLESFAVTVDQTVHWRSDTINVTPEPPPPPPPVSDATRRRSASHFAWGRRAPRRLRVRAPRPTPPGDIPAR